MKNRILSILLIAIMLFTVVGCGKKEGLDAYSKEEIIEAYTALNKKNTELQTKLTEMESLYNSLNIDSQPIAAIGYTGDGTGRLTFNSRDSMIVFPSTFQYPGAQQVKSNGSISITEGVFVSPGTNWVNKVNGTTLELEHSNGISGTIKVGQVTTAFGADKLRDEVLKPWFESAGIADKVVYTNIFTDSSQTAVGVDASVGILIDSEDAYLRCGMACVNGKTVTYVFVYRSQQDLHKDESITNTVNNIQIGNSKLFING